MGLLIRHEPCEACQAKGGDAKGDNKAVYDNGSTYCFACGEWTGKDRSESRFDDYVQAEPKRWQSRALTLDTMQKFGVGITDDARVAFPYYNSSGDLVAQKLRDADKEFVWVGKAASATMFGQQLWGSHGKSVTITEGEIDAMSLSQCFDNKWPVVSVRNGAAGAAADISKHIEWLETFEKIVLMFDNDEAGKDAAEQCAALFTPGKVFIAKLPLKDANEMLVAGRGAELIQGFWRADPYKPDGVIRAASAWDLMRERPTRGLAYPWKGLDDKLWGQRTREMVIWSGGPGGGKSALTKIIGECLMRVDEETVGYLGLEEHVSKSMLDFISISERRQLHLEEVPDAELRPMFERAFSHDRLVLVNHVGGMNMEALLPRLRHMVLGERCRWIILDHVSILLGDTATEGNERARLDEILTQLRMFAEQLNVGLHVICHLRKAKAGEKDWSEGRKITMADLRGTGALAQLASAVIGVERDSTSENSLVRCTSTIRVIKNRFAGKTGVACALRYNEETGEVRELTEEELQAEAGEVAHKSATASDLAEFEKAAAFQAAAKESHSETESSF